MFINIHNVALFITSFVSLQIPPTTYWPSTNLPLLYLRSPNLLSSTSSVKPVPQSISAFRVRWWSETKSASPRQCHNCHAPWFSSETLALYKSLTYLLTYLQPSLSSVNSWAGLVANLLLWSNISPKQIRQRYTICSTDNLEPSSRMEQYCFLQEVEIQQVWRDRHGYLYHADTVRT